MRRFVHETKRLVLRPLRRSDFVSWQRAFTTSLPAKNSWDRNPLPLSKCGEKVFLHYLERHKKLAREDRCYIYAAFLGRELVGFVDIGLYDRGCLQFANLGYQLFNPHWGKGFAQEMVRAGLKIGFKDLKLQRLEASIDLTNRRSIKLVKRLGFEREGIKKAYWYQHGRWDDQVIYVARPEHLKRVAEKS